MFEYMLPSAVNLLFCMLLGSLMSLILVRSARHSILGEPGFFEVLVDKIKDKCEKAKKMEERKNENES